jgi:hypothetical protein
MVNVHGTPEVSGLLKRHNYRHWLGHLELNNPSPPFRLGTELRGLWEAQVLLGSVW